MMSNSRESSVTRNMPTARISNPRPSLDKPFERQDRVSSKFELSSSRESSVTRNMPTARISNSRPFHDKTFDKQDRVSSKFEFNFDIFKIF